jgi:hypothetical protein
MNKFSSKQRESLFSSFVYRNGNRDMKRKYVEDELPNTLISVYTIIRGETILISSDSLYSVVCSNNYLRAYDITDEIQDFIHNVPFEEVALYINVFPDFAKWRLRIGE